MRLALVKIVLGLWGGLLLDAANLNGAERQSLDQLNSQLNTLVPTLIEEFHTPGVSIAVIHSRQVVLNRCFGVRSTETRDPVGPETLFEAASMSKPLFAAGVMRLVEQKQLDLDRPLCEYLAEPYLADEPLHQKITARMVLQHTSGFPNWRKGGWRAGGPLPVKFEPGTKFGYSGEGFLYLQRVVEKITGEKLETWMRRTVFEPLEMSQSSFVWHDDFRSSVASGHDASGKVKTAGKRFEIANAAFSLFTTPSDYARFLMVMMPDEKTAKSLLRRETIETMLQPSVATAKPNEWRALGWAVTKHHNDSFAWHNGDNGTGFRCCARFYPVVGNGVIVMTNGAGGEAVWKKVIDAIYPSSEP